MERRLTSVDETPNRRHAWAPQTADVITTFDAGWLTLKTANQSAHTAKPHPRARGD